MTARLGPVQVLVVGFDEVAFSGEVLVELDRLAEAGTVRLLDVLLVRRAQDGSLDTLAPPPDRDPGLGRVAAALFGASEGGGNAEGAVDGNAWSLDDAISPDGVAAVALIEHTWARPLVDAIRRVGGHPLAETWLAADDVALLERLLDDGRGRVNS